MRAALDWPSVNDLPRHLGRKRPTVALGVGGEVRGAFFMVLAAGPSPFPERPWHDAHLDWYSYLPMSYLPGSAANAANDKPSAPTAMTTSERADIRSSLTSNACRRARTTATRAVSPQQACTAGPTTTSHSCRRRACGIDAAQVAGVALPSRQLHPANRSKQCRRSASALARPRSLRSWHGVVPDVPQDVKR